MVVDDIQFMNILKGKRIKLTLGTSFYLGVVQRINPNKTLILTDVDRSGSMVPGPKMFYGHEILNGGFISDKWRDVHENRPEDQLKVEEFQPYRELIRMGHDEDEDEDDGESIHFEVINNFHEKFGPAVMHIKRQRVIGVGADGVELYYHGRLCWLQIATKNKVYLFDILLLGAQAFKNGLSMILENKQILKVIHDCRALAGCLIAQYGVKLTNVFDTQVADVMCFYSETGGFLPDRVSALHEVVNLHLKVPSSQLISLQMKSQLSMEEKEMWYKRPCPSTLLKVMALSVIHLQPLRLVLMDTLMTDYMALVDSYLNSSHYEPDELEHISMESVLELPRELRQLQQMHHERQEWAANYYRVTEQGLLARFNPQTESPSQPSPATDEASQTQADSFGPPSVESPSSAQLDPLLYQPPIRPQKVTSVSSVDVCASPDLPAQASEAAVSDFVKEISAVSPLSVGVGRGQAGVLMDTTGTGRAFGKEQSTVYTLPAIGRGFLHWIPPAFTPRESAGDMKSPGRVEATPPCPSLTPSQKLTPQPGTRAADLPKDTSGSGGDLSTPTPQSLSSSLKQSFRCFRY